MSKENKFDGKEMKIDLKVVTPTECSLDEAIGLVEDQIDALKKEAETLRKNKDGIKYASYRPINIGLISDPGVGKTARIQQLAADLDCPLAYISGDSLQAGELGGILIPIEEVMDSNEDKKRDKDGNHPKIMKAVKLAMEGLLPMPPQTKEEADDPNYPYNKPGIIFIDEMTSIPFQVRSELLTICGGTTVMRKDRHGKDTYPLVPPTWMIVGAMNTLETVQDLNRELYGYNVRCRFAWFNVHADCTTPQAKEYMLSRRVGAFEQQGWHPAVMAYLDSNSDMYNPAIPENLITKSQSAQLPNPRTWEQISDELHVLDNRLASGCFDYTVFKRKRELICKAKLGAVANPFLTYCEFKDEMIPVEELISQNFSKNPSKYKDYKDKVYNQVKIYSIYVALNELRTNKTLNDPSKAKAKLNAYTNLLTNVDWLCPVDGVEFLTGLLTQIQVDCPDIDPSKFNEQLQKQTIRAKQYDTEVK